MEDRNLLQHLQQQLRFARRDEPAQAAVLIAITREEQPKVLLTRRSLQLSSHAGEVSFPGGKRDLTDANNIAVALREAEEETGLRSENIELIGDLPTEQARSGITVKPVVGLIPHGLNLVAQPSEIDRIFFAPLQQLMQTKTVPHAVQYAGQTLYFPSLRVEDEIVWGLTARILMNLFKYGLSYEREWPFLLNATAMDTAEK